MRMSFSCFWTRKVSHLHLWKTHNSFQQPQALGDDNQEANTCCTPKVTENASPTAEVRLHPYLQTWERNDPSRQAKQISIKQREHTKSYIRIYNI